MLNFLRISEREKEHQQKRLAFDTSLNQFRQSVREKTKPQNLLKDHPQILLAGLIAGASLMKLLFGKRGVGFKKIISFVAGSGLKAFAPFLFKTLASLFSKK